MPSLTKEVPTILKPGKVLTPIPSSSDEDEDDKHETSSSKSISKSTAASSASSESSSSSAHSAASGIPTKGVRPRGEPNVDEEGEAGSFFMILGSSFVCLPVLVAVVAAVFGLSGVVNFGNGPRDYDTVDRAALENPRLPQIVNFEPSCLSWGAGIGAEFSEVDAIDSYASGSASSLRSLRLIPFENDLKPNVMDPENVGMLFVDDTVLDKSLINLLDDSKSSKSSKKKSSKGDSISAKGAIFDVSMSRPRVGLATTVESQIDSDTVMKAVGLDIEPSQLILGDLVSRWASFSTRNGLVSSRSAKKDDKKQGAKTAKSGESKSSLKEEISTEEKASQMHFLKAMRSETSACNMWWRFAVEDQIPPVPELAVRMRYPRDSVGANAEIEFVPCAVKDEHSSSSVLSDGSELHAKRFNYSIGVMSTNSGSKDFGVCQFRENSS